MFKKLREKFQRVVEAASTTPQQLAELQLLAGETRQAIARMSEANVFQKMRTLMSIKLDMGDIYFYTYAANDAPNETPMLIQEIIEANEKQNGESYDFTGIDFREGDVVLDVGANFGLTSLYLAKKYPQIRIIALEPIPSTFELLQENVRINQLKNVTVLQKAMTGDGRDVPMVFSPGASLGACVLGNMQQVHAEYVQNFPGATLEVVPSITLDQIMEQFGIDRCRLLKIDCEGSEDEVIRSSHCLDRIDHVRGELHLPKADSDSLESLLFDRLGREKVQFSRHLLAA